MPRLIVLDGPPAVGKSTLARRYVQEHPLALALDLDTIRLLMGQQAGDSDEGRLAARDLALAMARTHLQAGHDVVVPQYLGRPDFLDRLEALAVEAGADFHELVLMDSAHRLEERFARRSQVAARPEHLLASRGADGEGPDSLTGMRQRLVDLVAHRPYAVVIDCPENQEELAYRAVLQALGRGA